MLLRLLGSVVSASMFLVACSLPVTGTEGHEWGLCRGDGSCDGTLQCVSGICMDMSAVPDAPDAFVEDSGQDVAGRLDAEGEVVPCQSDCGEMVGVPGGSFHQGCNEDYLFGDCLSDEYPYHPVSVPPFSIDRLEATVALYERCMAAGGCTPPKGAGANCNHAAGRASHPVNCITWDQGSDLCRWVGKRLCTESEWEKAARGTDERKHPWGADEPTCGLVVMDEGGDGCGTGTTAPAGSRPAGQSPCGALDMLGNVSEFVEDDWHVTYTPPSGGQAPNDGSAWVEDLRNTLRVTRGGSFVSRKDDLRCSLRNNVAVGNENEVVGVRCCSSN